MRRPFILVCLALATSGCLPFGSENVPGCSGGPAGPLATVAVEKALTSHDFTVHLASDSAICGGDTVADVTNIHFSGPFENIQSHDEISRREGAVFCGVRRHALRGSDLEEDLDAPAASPIFSGRKTEFFLANVECTLYPGEDDAETQIARLHDAMTELEAQIRT